MKKYLQILGIFFAFGLFLTTPANAYQIQADAQTKRIPMGTKLELEMANNLLQSSLSAGDMFTSYLTRDVRTTTVMILPRGTIVRGNITKTTDPKRPSKDGSIYLNFDHLVAPNGEQIPISAGLCEDFPLDDNGGIKGEGTYKTKVKKNWSKSGSIIKKATKWGISSGEDLFKGGKYLVTPFSAVGGSIAGAGYFVGVSAADLFKKGSPVDIKKGTVFNILLLEAVDVPVSE